MKPLDLMKRGSRIHLSIRQNYLILNLLLTMRPANEPTQIEFEKQYKKLLKDDINKLEHRYWKKIRIQKNKKFWLDWTLYRWKQKFYFSDLFEINRRLKEQIYI